MVINVSEIDLKLDPFVPLLNFETAHSQTVLGHVMPSKIFRQDSVSEILTLEDGDKLHIRYFRNDSPYVVAVFHGLAGDEYSDYMQRTARIAYELGHSVVLVEHRGVGKTRHMQVKPYHSGRGEDAAQVSLRLRELFANKKQIFIGFSLSGSVLLNLITRRRGSHLPDVSVIVNAPINLSRSSRLLTKGFSKIYDIRFYFLIKKLVRERYVDAKLPLIGKTKIIDEMFTSKYSGFKDAEDYYTQCSTYQFTEDISIPTFILTSEDDPFISFDDYKNARWNLLTHRTFVKHGGHMGYISRVKHQKHGRRWLDHYLYRVLKSVEQL